MPAAGVRAQESHDNVVIVLDCSGSMNERLAGTQMKKMEAAKEALKAVIQKVPQSTRIGLIVFGLVNQREDWAYPLGPRDDVKLAAAIDALQPSSGTPLGRYIKKGADRLLEERQKQFGYGTYRLLVVTDGEAQDKELVDRFTPEVIARGVTVDVIGVGMKKDHTLATKVHSYRRANDPESFQRAVSEVFAEIAGTSSDSTQAEAFDLLAAIPSEVAASMIQALSSSGNHPIGTRPASPRQQTAQPANLQPKATATPTPTVNQHQPVSQAPRKKFPKWAIIIGVLIMLSLFRKRRRARP
jgi:uncharacterized protein YegL